MITPDLKISNWSHELNNAVLDKEVGISLAFLAGDDSFRSYVAEFKPGSHITAHYHPEGIEIYQILSGKGLMKTGSLLSNNDVTWNQPVDVQSGDFFTITPKMVHQLENNFSESLILIVTCSPSNLGHNRIVIK